jgi:hypothetical protein
MHVQVGKPAHSARNRGLGLSEQETQSGILRVALIHLLEAWSVRNDTSVGPKDQWNHIVSMLGQFKWDPLRYRSSSLVVGDTTVCLYGTAQGQTSQINDAWARHGIGVGFETCARITMPLTPQLGLLLTRDGKPARLGAERFNQATVYESREFVAHSPDWPEGRARLEKAFRDDLQRQRFLGAAFRPHM